MSVESVLDRVLVRLGLGVSTPKLASSDVEMAQIRVLMTDAGRDIARRAEWPKLNRVLTVPGPGSSVPLPADFEKFAEGGAIRLAGAGFSPVRVVVSPEQWEFLAANPSSQPYCHLTEGELRFSPDFGTGGVIIRYVSNQWSSAGDRVTQNGDELFIPERLLETGTVWRWLRQKGFPFDDVLAEHEADLLDDIKAARGVA